MTRVTEIRKAFKLGFFNTEEKQRGEPTIHPELQPHLSLFTSPCRGIRHEACAVTGGFSLSQSLERAVLQSIKSILSIASIPSI